MSKNKKPLQSNGVEFQDVLRRTLRVTKDEAELICCALRAWANYMETHDPKYSYEDVGHLPEYKDVFITEHIKRRTLLLRLLSDRIAQETAK